MIAESIALLGKQVKDRVTGFSGMVSSISFDAYGCIQAIVSPPIGKDGKPGEQHWFDVKRLVETGKRLMDAPTFGTTAASIPGGERHSLPPQMPKAVKSILDPSFRYVPAASTDLRKTFARIRREAQQRAQLAKPPANVAPIFTRKPGAA